MATTVCVDTVPAAGGFELDPLCFTIRFTGNAQSLAIPEHLPIQISVHVPDKFLGQISPMISEYSNPRAQHTLSRPRFLNPEFFPFFPLPSTFDLLDSVSWQMLVHQIQFHLVQPEDNLTWEEHVTECLLVREFFWMAFVAAFPSFPYGNWPNWNPRISMDGDFISYWISDTDVDSVKPESVGTIREFIWEELKVLVAHVLPPRIVSEFLT
ncbi:hypothetical protein BU15DRAFT_76001 [Melanogaster broomeanus]|nr:hypothetical protein BU15DRAFT_76001 [Melanogaster broomeanus]